MGLIDFLTNPSGQALLETILAPLLVAGLIVVGRKHPRRTVLVLAIGALVLLLAGTLGWDIASGLRTADFVAYQQDKDAIHGQYDIAQRNFFRASFLALFFGYFLFLGASALGLIQTLRLPRRRWFTATLLSFVLFSVIGLAPFANVLYLVSLVLAPFPVGGYPDYGTTIFHNNLGAMAAFYLIMTLVTAALPVPALLYGLKGPDQYTAQRTARAPAADATSPESPG
jgi:hypothetical protein